MANNLPSGLTITYFGHATFLVELPNGKRILIDPFLQGNPVCPPDKKNLGAQERPVRVDVLLVTHGHFDHFADVVPVAQETGCTVFCSAEISAYLGKQGLQKIEPMNKGGSVHNADAGVTVTMTHAMHSNSFEADNQMVYGGEPAGYVVTTDDGFAFYFAGDTAAFGDMALLSELYAPTLAFLPIGDRFTMGPKEAAKAVTLMPSVEYVVPMHYATFGLLTGTPEAFQDELIRRDAKAQMLTMTPGETRTF